MVLTTFFGMIRLGLFINSMSARHSFTISCIFRESSSTLVNLATPSVVHIFPHQFKADNLEFKVIIGHRFRHQGGLQFLCHWKDYAPEDSIYRNADAIVHPVARALIARYIRSLDFIQQDLGDWISENLWALEMHINAPPMVSPPVPAVNCT